MFSILPNLIARLKALVLTFLVADLEADLIAAAAERKAELLRQAVQYEQQNLPSVAAQVRNQTATLSPDRPLTSVTTAIKHLHTDPAPSIPADASAPLPQQLAPPPPPPSPEALPPTSRKKKDKHDRS